MSMQTHRFSVTANCETGSIYEDRGFLILPETYSDTGEPTRMVICCHGAGGTVTTDDSQVEHQALTHYLVVNGYAVMDVNGLPEEFARERGIDIRNNIGNPMAIRSYIAAYRYCMAHFNLKPKVFVHGGSMGGISSTNLVFSGQIPVIAHSAFCPVLDTYHQIFLHPWSDGLPKIALGKFYNLDTDTDGEYIYDESKVAGYNPIQTLREKPYPVPVAFWHCEDDDTVSCATTKEFVALVNAGGGAAQLTTFPKGGHEPQLVGESVADPAGIDVLNGEKILVRPAVEGVFRWIQKFETR